jgi:hypothetical protein
LKYHWRTTALIGHLKKEMILRSFQNCDLILINTTEFGGPALQSNAVPKLNKIMKKLANIKLRNIFSQEKLKHF